MVIGQSAEFDYTDMQACNAFEQEGYKVALLNLTPTIGDVRRDLISLATPACLLRHQDGGAGLFQRSQRRCLPLVIVTSLSGLLLGKKQIRIRACMNAVVRGLSFLSVCILWTH
jgi:hypothetical protein